VKGVVGEFRQLPGPEHGVRLDEHRRRDLGPPGSDVHVEHELPKRAVKAGQRPGQDGKARAGDIGSRVGVVAEAEREGVVFAWREVEGGRGAMGIDDDVGGLVEAVGNVGGGEVGEGCEDVFKVARGLLAHFHKGLVDRILAQIGLTQKAVSERSIARRFGASDGAGGFLGGCLSQFFR